MALTIVTADVGAGYTGVLAGRDKTALIDFGGGSASKALHALSRVTKPHCWPWWYSLRSPGKDPLPFDAFVLSHPHRDHYNGLLALEKKSNSALQPLLKADADFYHPRLPSDPVAAELALRLVALKSIERLTSGVPDFTVIRAIKRCGGTRARRKPLRQGHTVKLAGELFDVLWPPERLPLEARASLRSIVDSYDALADEAASHDDTALKDAVDRLREPETFDVEEAVYGSSETPYEEDHTPPEQEEHDPTDKPSVQDSDDSPYAKQLGELKQAVSNGANLLSLVLASQRNRRYVFLGDIDRSLHDEIAPHLVGFTPEVVSSAHHGTHFDSALATLRSRYVISSVGGELKNNVCPEYDSMGMHLRTDYAGDIVALTESDRTVVWAGPVKP